MKIFHPVTLARLSVALCQEGFCEDIQGGDDWIRFCQGTRDGTKTVQIFADAEFGELQVSLDALILGEITLDLSVETSLDSLKRAAGQLLDHMKGRW